MGLHAIITAGGGVPRDLRTATEVKRKALIEVGGRTMLLAAVQAAHGCLLIDRVVVLGNDEVAAATPAEAEGSPSPEEPSEERKEPSPEAVRYGPEKSA